jgi:hypothetical protein
VHATPDRLLRHTVAISTAHDEYWTKVMRDGFQSARDKGVNLIFFGANAMYRQVRLQPSPHGPLRREVCYKSASEDPIAHTDPSLTTVNWRDSPVGLPEASIIGIEYDGQGFADLEVNNPDGWIWDSTGVGHGQKFKGVVGPEFDKVFSSSPGNVEVFARSAITDKSGRDSWADVAYYSAPSGAGVFSTGTIGWISRLSPGDITGVPVEPQLYHATMNVLRLFGAGSAGTAKPSVGNSSSIHASPLPKKPPPPLPPSVPPEAPPDTSGGGGGGGGLPLP